MSDRGYAQGRVNPSRRGVTRSESGFALAGAPFVSHAPVVKEGRKIVWRSEEVHDCPLCGLEVRPARQRNGTAVLLDPAGALHPVICGGPS